MFLGSGNYTDDDAEEDHETGGASNEGTELLVVNHVHLAWILWCLDLVTPTTLGVQIEDNRFGDEIPGVIGAWYLRSGLRVSSVTVTTPDP